MILKKIFVVASVLLFFLTPFYSIAAPFNEQRKFIGQEYDSQTGLDYLNARYYDAKRGQFISQDPLARDNPEQFLTDPQQLNSYSYARNNPISLSDPSGLIPTPNEAALMANQIYQNGNEGKNLSGGWQYGKALTQEGTGMKMGVYSRMQTDTQCVPLEYSLVSQGTRGFTNISDWLNNLGQPFGTSLDMRAAIEKGKSFAEDHSGNEITFVGHSKGGAEANAGALRTNKNAILFNPATLNVPANGLSDYVSTYSAHISTYMVRGEMLTTALSSFSRPGPNESVIQLSPTHSLSLGQALRYGLIRSTLSNSYQNHSMQSVINGLNK